MHPLANRFLYLRLFLMLLPLLWTRSSLSALSSPAEPQYRPDTSWRDMLPSEESNEQLMAQERATPPIWHPPKPFLTTDVPGLAHQATHPATGGNTGESLASGNGLGSGHRPLSPQTPDVNFLGASYSDGAEFPPDSMGAIGPAQFIVAINNRIRTFSKTNGVPDGVLDVSPDTFFASVLSKITGTFASDPHIRYDRLSGRWFIIMIDVPGGAPTSANHIMIAMSSTNVLTAGSTWRFYYFVQDGVIPSGDNGLFGDYPTPGIDANAIYIGVNLFNSSGSFINSTGYVVRKSSLLAGGPIFVRAFRDVIVSGQGPKTAQGVDNFDLAATEGYFIGVDATSKTNLQLLRVTDPGGTPSISSNITIAVAQFASPMSVDHRGNTGGTNGRLDALDNRLLAAHYRDGSLWTAHNIGVDNVGNSTGTTITRDGVRWYQLGGIPTGQTPGVVQSGTVFTPSATNSTDQRSYWMGTIMVSGQKHAALGFSTAGTLEFANAGTVGRLSTDPLNTMETPVLYTAATFAYNPSGDPGGTRGRRWGDFSYTSLDPSDDMTMWTIQEYCSAQNIWGVRVARLLAPPPATPTNCTPAYVTQAVANVTVLLQGSSTNGSGFFEPGTNFANHLSAAINGGGVAVTSMSYTDPTNLVLTVSVASNAAPGLRTVTVTNPDGQSATSVTGLLVVIKANVPPTLAPIPDWAVSAGTLLIFTNLATDPDVPPEMLAFSLGTGAGLGATLTSDTGIFSWTPSLAQIGTNAFSVIVTDNGNPPLSATQAFNVVVVLTNYPPTLAPIASQTIHAMMILSFTNSASDPDVGDALTFSLDPGAPAGAAVNPASGVFRWMPTDSQIGSFPMTVRVTDSWLPPQTDAQSFSVTVVPRPTANVSISGNTLSLTWSAIANRTYRVQVTSDIASGAWSDLAPDIVAGGPDASYPGIGATNSTAFYRVLVVR